VTFWLAVIALLLLLQMPLLVIYTRRTTRKDHARIAKTLVESNAGVAKQLATDHAETRSALGQIHTLVNSNLTDAQRLQLAAMRALQIQSQQVISMKQDRGVPVADDVENVRLVASAIEDLARNIAHKQEQTDIADEQVERDRRDR
jgi:hypothetical protein